MAQIDSLDLIVLILVAAATAAWFTKGKLWAVKKDPYALAFANVHAGKPAGTRDIVQKMNESNKNCVVFFGSQTGTAEDYASRLAKEGKSRFGLETMVADLEEYDYDCLDTMPKDKVVMFILATYGEGEPTDNAVDFWEFINGEDVSFSEDRDSKLDNLTYVTFGLGNNTYEHYNSMVRGVDAALQKLGAKRVGAAGEGDDGAGTLEEDFLAWKDPMWEELVKTMGLEEREAVYEPTFEVQDRDDLSASSPEVYLGEPNKKHLNGQALGPFNSQNPYIAPIAESRELFAVKDRHCLHMEIDISGGKLSYQTGDHVAIWPTNAGEEVDRLLAVLGLIDKRRQVISVKSLEPTAKVPFPSPTTLDAILRYHLEICAPVSRQFVATLAAFSPNDAIKQEMTRLGNDKEYFHSKTGTHFYNIARLLELIGNGETWNAIPFSAFIEGLNKLQPRYYSISSSARMQPKKVSVTAVIEVQAIPGRKDPFRGVTTNYLYALKQKQHDEPNPESFGQTYEINGPRNKYDGVHVPVHIRSSNFKLPSDPSRPIIMVGPGTGVAPFRGFIQERVKMQSDGGNVGKSILFFGCRKRSEDFLYKDEWETYGNELGDKFELITAFSRETSKKVYVQNLLKERSKEINELLTQRANFYVCGDAANMAREVNAELVQIIVRERGVAQNKAEDIVKSMRLTNQYQEDVWS